MATLSVELASIPPILDDREFTKYLIAGALYSKGILSGEQARKLTGDPRRVFEEKTAQYGFPMMPDGDDEILAEVAP